MSKKFRKAIIYISLFFALFLSIFISLFLGTQKITISQFFSAILQKENPFHTIIFSIRLPRTLLALISGALLASSGAVIQIFFRNSLAEPGIIGISSASTLGAVFAQSFLSFSLGFISTINLFAFISALLFGIFLIIISSKTKTQSSITILLCGTACGTLFSAISSILLLTKTRTMNGIYTWILGSFNGKSAEELKIILIPSILSIFLMLHISKNLDILISGEKTALTLGANIKKIRFYVLFSASLAVSCAVFAGGTINFTGLIAPHLARKIFNEKKLKAKQLILISMLIGAILVVLSDTIARIIIAPSELPCGLITSILGSPFFISLIFAKKGKFYEQN